MKLGEQEEEEVDDEEEKEDLNPTSQSPVFFFSLSRKKSFSFSYSFLILFSFFKETSISLLNSGVKKLKEELEKERMERMRVERENIKLKEEIKTLKMLIKDQPPQTRRSPGGFWSKLKSVFLIFFFFFFFLYLLFFFLQSYFTHSPIQSQMIYLFK